MTRSDLISHCLARISAVAVVCLLVPANGGAQTQWAVTLTPTMDPLPAGFARLCT